MRLEQEAEVQDLRPGDVVWIKFIVEEAPTKSGNVLLRYLGRPGVDEYARSKISDAFIRPDMFNWARRLWLRAQSVRVS